MAAPTYTWNTIAATQTDADSPLDTTLMEAERQNLIHLEEWLGDAYTAAKNHDHDGVNSAQAVMADDGLSSVKLKRQGEIVIFDDFLFDNLSGLWTPTGTPAVITGDNGILRLTGTGDAITNGMNGKPFKVVSPNTLSFEVSVKSSVTNTLHEFGFTNGSQKITFKGNGTYWYAYTVLSGTTSTSTAVVPSTTAYQKLKAVATATSVAFYIDGVLKATHTTQIPTATMYFMATTIAGPGSNYSYLDYIHIWGNRN
ncbi:MAG: hypothetical protein HY890_05665 [Deltaproteobacteria bacterium]|nr:hypothetical protein [Deltaproteobacteria bacterium]